jgi:hypothetical protein
MRTKRTIQLTEDKALNFSFDLFGEEEEINMTQLLKIDISNIHADYATFAIVLNQVSLVQVEADYNVNMAKMNLEKYEAELAERLRNDFEPEEGSRSKTMSNERVNHAIAKDPKYLVKKQIYFKRLKEQGYINSLYWSMKSKDEKLNRLMNNLHTEDMEEALLNKKIKKYNYIDMKIFNSQV